ncbi:MAG: hypothetical protein WCX32_01870 [Clostridia bacterium]|jgi:hypothetical protein|nr:hypothetical protein [Clostridia bacterium]
MTSKQIPISLSCIVYYTLLQNNNKAITVEYIEKLVQTLNEKFKIKNLNYELCVNSEDIAKMVNSSLYADFFNKKIKLLTEATLANGLKKLKNLVQNILTDEIKKLIDESMQELAKQKISEEQKEPEIR